MVSSKVIPLSPLPSNLSPKKAAIVVVSVIVGVGTTGSVPTGTNFLMLADKTPFKYLKKTPELVSYNPIVISVFVVG